MSNHKDEIEAIPPRDLIRRFHMCANYPRNDEAAAMFLAQDLVKASRLTGVDQAEIVGRCAEVSTFCPTGADLLAVAREIVRLRQVADGTYDAMEGHGSHARHPRETECAACGDSGWVIIWTLHTITGKQPWKFAQRENITEAVAAEIGDRLPPNQRVWSGAARCGCRKKAEVA